MRIPSIRFRSSVPRTRTTSSQPPPMVVCARGPWTTCASLSYVNTIQSARSTTYMLITLNGCSCSCDVGCHHSQEQGYSRVDHLGSDMHGVPGPWSWSQHVLHWLRRGCSLPCQSTRHVRDSPRSHSQCLRRIPLEELTPIASTVTKEYRNASRAILVCMHPLLLVAVDRAHCVLVVTLRFHSMLSLSCHSLGHGCRHSPDQGIGRLFVPAAQLVGRLHGPPVEHQGDSWTLPVVCVRRLHRLRVRRQVVSQAPSRVCDRRCDWRDHAVELERRCRGADRQGEDQ